MGTVLADKDLDLPLKSFEKFVENVASNGDEGQKAKVLKKLKDFNDLINLPKNEGSSKVLRAKTNRRKVEIPELPYEIWIKIMNYLPTNDIFHNLAYVNKNSYQLTKDTKALKHLTFNGLSSHYRKAEFKKGMQFLKKCTNLVGLTIDYCKTEDWQKIVETAFIASPNIKYFEILGDGTSECDFNDCDIYHGDELSIEVVKTMKKHKTKLENLLLEGTYVDTNVMDEISKIETLKSLSIDISKCVLTPEVVESLASNNNQLEILEIDDREKREETDGYDDHGWCDFDDSFLRTALNDFFEKKKDTLKIIKRINTGSPYCDDAMSCESLKNLSLCKNLVEFFGSLHEHELVHLAGLENLQKLKLYEGEYRHGKYLKFALGNMNLSKLKYLSITSIVGKEFCKELARHHFPGLERLSISCPEMTSKCFQQLIKNGPNLKSIQFAYGSREYSISNKILHKLCKDTDVLVIFGHVIKNDKNKEQNSFEEYLIENDLIVFRKYKRMKQEFEKWCEDNFEHGF